MVEDGIFGIVRDIVDGYVGVREQPLDDGLEVLVIPAAFGIKHQMLVGDLEEALVVLLLPLPVFRGDDRPRLKIGLELLEFRLRATQSRIVNVLLRRNAPVLAPLHHDGKEIAGRPIKPHARRDKTSEKKRDANRDAVRDELLGARLLVLERIEDVLRITEQPSRRASEERHQPRIPAIRPWDASDKRFRRAKDGQLVSDSVNHLDECHQNQDLDRERHQRQQGMVMLSLEKRRRLFADRIRIAVMIDLDPIGLWHQRNHLQRVHLAPE